MASSDPTAGSADAVSLGVPTAVRRGVLALVIRGVPEIRLPTAPRIEGEGAYGSKRSLADE